MLTHWRESRGLTKADAARLLEVPYRTFQDWELGNREPRAFTRRAIVAELKRK